MRYWLVLFVLMFGGGQNITEPTAMIKPWYRTPEEKEIAVRMGSVGWEDVDL
jgi:hypothetical protein